MAAAGRASPDLSEREFTCALARFLPSNANVVVGIGDDAAVVKNRGAHGVLCCDPVVAGVHFTAATPLHLVGRKAVNRNLADLAAMAARPDYLLVSVVLPKGLGARERRQLFTGIRAAAQRAQCVVVGGDVAVATGRLIVTVTAVGHLPGRVLLRSTAAAGDSLHVSGPLGGSILGHHLKFKPPLAEGCWLAQQPTVHAAMDVSDGLVLDLQTLLLASGRAGAELHAGAIPVSAAARRLARGRADAALRHALGDGEDHVLLWTQAAGELAAGGPLSQRARRPIGRVVDEPGIWLVHRNGRRQCLMPDLGGSTSRATKNHGFQHDFAGTQRVPARRSRRHPGVR